MKALKRLTVIAVVALPMLFTGCSEDVYEEGKVRQIAPADNPFGEGFMAPAGFDWSNSVSVNLNVEVKDEYSGKYKYLVEVFTDNPRINTSLAPIAAGYAQSGANYTTKITVAKNAAKIYLRQTAPSQSVSYFEYAVPTTNGSTLNCKLYNTGASTRATDAGTSGWDLITTPTVTELTEPTYTLPTTWDEILYGNQLFDGNVYVIPAGTTFSGDITCYKGNDGAANKATVYVAGTWNSNSYSPQGLDIIVMSGGTLSGGNFTVGDCSSLTILSGGKVECDVFNTAATSSGLNVTVKNFGTFIAKQGIRNQYNATSWDGFPTVGLGTSTYIYNAPNATFTISSGGLGADASGTIINLGTMNITGGAYFNTGNVIYNDVNKTLNITGNISFTSAEIHNKGAMTIGGNITTNNTSAAVIANYAGASLTLNNILGGATIVNSGYMKTTNCDSNGSSEYFYNNCTFIATNLFKWRTVVLDHGSITAGQDSEGNWLPVPTVQNYNDCNYTLKNGSIIKAATFDLSASGGNYVVGEGTPTSMVQASSVMKCNWHVYVSGNIVLDVESMDYSGVGESCFHADGIPQTQYGKSTVTIENCSGIVYEAPPVVVVEDPVYPTIIGDYTGYTYAFEDLWPVYGDYDMNDLVLSIDETILTVGADGYVQEASINGRVKAIGATYVLGFGIQFLALPSSVESDAVTLNGVTTAFESENSHPTLIVTEDARTYLGNNEGEGSYINTEVYGRSNSARAFGITITFADKNVIAEDFDIEKLDVFIFCKKGAYVPFRREVHLAGYSATNWADQSYNTNTANDNGSGMFVSKENMVWGIRIPSSEWRWPQESMNIQYVYLNFINWVTNGGSSYTDWWDSSNSDNANTSLLY